MLRFACQGLVMGMVWSGCLDVLDFGRINITIWCCLGARQDIRSYCNVSRILELNRCVVDGMDTYISVLELGAFGEG